MICKFDDNCQVDITRISACDDIVKSFLVDGQWISTDKDKYSEIKFNWLMLRA